MSDQDKTLLAQIGTEIQDLKRMATAFGPERIKDGTWFNEFIKAMLQTYSQKIIEGGGIEFFRRKYPGLTQDTIAAKLCNLATRYAALAGGTSGLTASTSVLGGFTIPAIVAAIGSEILYTTRLQVRLIYDLSTIYGDPIDVDDPEHLFRAFSLAYGVSAATGSAGGIVKAVAPEVARAQTYRFITGKTPIIQEAAIRWLGPRIGSQITRKAIIKAAVPLAGIAISSSWNYLTTQQIGAIASNELRLGAKARDAVRDLCAGINLAPEDAPLIVQSMQAIMGADGNWDPRELEVYKFVVSHLGVSSSILEDIESRVEIAPNSVERQLYSVTKPELRHAIAELIKLTAASSGEISGTESNLLERFLVALGEDFNLIKLQKQTASFKRSETKQEQMSRVVRGAASKAGQGILSAGKAIGVGASGLFRKKIISQQSSSSSSSIDDEKNIPEAQMEAIQRLKVLQNEGILTDEEFNIKKAEILASVDIKTSEIVSPPDYPRIRIDNNTLQIVKIQALINLVKIDGTIDDIEKEFLASLVSNFEIDEDQKLDLRKRLLSKVPLNVDFSIYEGYPHESIGLIVDLANMASQDGVFHPAEKIYIKQVGKLVAFSDKDIEELITGYVV